MKWFCQIKQSHPDRTKKVLELNFLMKNEMLTHVNDVNLKTDRRTQIYNTMRKWRSEVKI